MKLTLLDALHARPANLFVRVASSYVAVVEIRKGERCADAKNILEVLTLGAAKGDELELVATGDDAEAALLALATLVERNFDADLVPETGAAAASGIAVGPALVLGVEERNARDASSGGDASSSAEIGARVERALRRVESDLEAMVQALPAAEAALFEPEIAIVRALQAPSMARVLRGETLAFALDQELSRRSDAVREPCGMSDLFLDARERLLEAYEEGPSSLLQRLGEGPQGEVVLVAHALTPSLVAALPRRVIGIVALLDEAHGEGAHGVGYASHAAILARGRGIPLLFVAPHVAHTIAEGDAIVVDTRATPARLWTSPSEARLAEAQAAWDEEQRRRREAEASAAPALTNLPSFGGAPFSVRVNIGSLHDFVPVASDGVGLVRTELLHSGRTRAPTLEEQLAMLVVIAGKVSNGPIVARLFDGGGDKPIAWLPAPTDAPGARGVDLLFRHPDVLRVQIDAVARAAVGRDVRLLLPIVRDPSDVERVRALAPRSMAIGAMIETPEAVRVAADIARVADFVCIGTNDLTASVRGEDRAHAAAAPLDPRVLTLIGEIVDAAHRAGRAVTVCGEMAGEPEGATVLAGLGVDAVSVAPSRLLAVRNALAGATVAFSVEALQRAMGKGKKTP